MKIEFEQWHIEVDVEATTAAYALIQQGDAEECGCSMCRNFVAQRKKAYPSEVLQLFEQLGVDANREMHTSEIITAPGKHLYIISHCFVGTVEQVAQRETGSTYFFPRNVTPRPFPTPTVTAETTVVLPWVIDESEPLP